MLQHVRREPQREDGRRRPSAATTSTSPRSCSPASPTSSPRRPGRRTSATTTARSRPASPPRTSPRSRRGSPRRPANVRTAMRNAGYADTAWTMLVQNYASPIPHGCRLPLPRDQLPRQGTGGCGFWNHDADWANGTALPTINGTVAARSPTPASPTCKTLDLPRPSTAGGCARTRVGLYEEKGLTQLDPARRGRPDRVGQPDPHRVHRCSAPVPLQESLHPNYWAQLALRTCVRQAWNGGAPRGGTCAVSGTGLAQRRAADVAGLHRRLSRPAAGSASPSASATRAGRPAAPRRGSRWSRTRRQSPRAGDHDVAEPRQHRRRDRAEPAARDRLVAGQHLGPVAEHARARRRPRRRRRPPRSRGAGTAPRRRSARPRRAAPGRRRRRPGGRPAQSTMPWSATTSSRASAGSASRSCSASASMIASCWSHWARGDAVAVAGPVEVAVVEVGERGPVARTRRAPRRSARPTRSAPTKSAAALRGHGQPGAAELALVHDRHARPRRPRAAERRAGAAATATGSTSLSHDSALSSRSVPGTREVKPTTPCVPGGQPGAERGQAGRGRRGHPGGGRWPRVGQQRREVRRGVGVARPAGRSRGRRPGTRRTTAPRAARSAGRLVGGAASGRARRRPRAARRRATGRRTPARRTPGRVASGSGSRVLGPRRQRLGEGQQRRRPPRARRRRPRPGARSRRRPGRRCSRGRRRTRGRRSWPARGRAGATPPQPMVSTASAGGRRARRSGLVTIRVTTTDFTDASAIASVEVEV